MTYQKYVFVGDEQSGKSALIQRYLKDIFDEVHVPTVSDSFFDSDGSEMCDTSGSAEFDRLRPFSYDRVSAWVVCYAVDNHMSLQTVQEKWVPEIRYFAPTIPLILVACKADLRDSPEVAASLAKLNQKLISTQEGVKVAKDIKAFKFVECSAKTGHGIHVVFDNLATDYSQFELMDLDEAATPLSPTGQSPFSSKAGGVQTGGTPYDAKLTGRKKMNRISKQLEIRRSTSSVLEAHSRRQSTLASSITSYSDDDDDDDEGSYTDRSYTDDGNSADQQSVYSGSIHPSELESGHPSMPRGKARGPRPVSRNSSFTSHSRYSQYSVHEEIKEAEEEEDEDMDTAQVPDEEDAATHLLHDEAAVPAVPAPAAADDKPSDAVPLTESAISPEPPAFQPTKETSRAHEGGVNSFDSTHSRIRLTATRSTTWNRSGLRTKSRSLSGA
ncbi:P-loop containing nucleoside triphosphate hydrolase protein [Polychytrium aggregatum]|uniref:P-loop containing nucleoside triphosphate hydrolase protein n=1 Tax=Polychytrium aggregatum TaxID=110093 RepID=UPI0022FDF3E7|nr:P-loop containing nucleoside triphosphate hydrolase protein [Polychytrium aggregatum]KAI9206455.1 P-loop containing nucleoside triphosphate hydrolase protein [Polychytrium aggregatum]